MPVSLGAPTWGSQAHRWDQTLLIWANEDGHWAYKGLLRDQSDFVAHKLLAHNFQ